MLKKAQSEYGELVLRYIKRHGHRRTKQNDVAPEGDEAQVGRRRITLQDRDNVVLRRNPVLKKPSAHSQEKSCCYHEQQNLKHDKNRVRWGTFSDRFIRNIHKDKG